MRLSLKRTLHLSGSAVALAGVGFVGNRLITHAGELDFALLGFWEGAVLAGLAVVYGTSNALLALAWWRLLNVVGIKVSAPTATKLYGISQLGKYIPGNVFQFAGRQALGIAKGMPGWRLARSVVWELSVISFAGVTFLGLLSPLFWPSFSLTSSGAIVLAVLTAIFFTLRRVAGTDGGVAYLYHCSFLAISSIIFLCTLAIVSESAGIRGAVVIPVCGTYIIAWLAGLITPGAPAGIGVREAVIVFLLEGNYPGAELVVATLLVRVVTILGDSGFFVVTWCIKDEARTGGYIQ